MKTLDHYLADLQTRGFKLGEDAIGFIYFGRKYTNASDLIVQTAIEVTLKSQHSFDSSFYMSVLEEVVRQKLSTRAEMIAHFKEKGITL